MSVKKIISVCLIVFISKIVLVNIIAKSDRFTVTFLNVGQGDSAVMHLPGIGNILIDGGADLSVENSGWVYFGFPFCNIKYMFLSHLHSDHSVGLENVLKRCTQSFNTFNIIGVYSYTPNIFDEKVITKLSIKKGTVTLNQQLAGSIKTFILKNGDQVKFYFLWPERNYDEIKNENDRSLVILVDYKSYEILFTGDASGDILDRLVTPQLQNLIQDGLDVYKISHHGSLTGKSEKLLKSLKPRNCVISVGKNSFGHPNESIIKDLEASQCLVHRTDREGNVEFVL